MCYEYYVKSEIPEMYLSWQKDEKQLHITFIIMEGISSLQCILSGSSLFIIVMIMYKF